MAAKTYLDFVFRSFMRVYSAARPVAMQRWMKHLRPLRSMSLPPSAYQTQEMPFGDSFKRSVGGLGSSGNG
jgi:hypothetical protein